MAPACRRSRTGAMVTARTVPQGVGMVFGRQAYTEDGNGRRDAGLQEDSACAAREDHETWYRTLRHFDDGVLNVDEAVTPFATETASAVCVSD